MVPSPAMLRTIIRLSQMLRLQDGFGGRWALQIDDTRTVQLAFVVVAFGVQGSNSVVWSFLQLGGPLLYPVKDLFDILVSTQVEHRHGLFHNQH